MYRDSRGFGGFLESMMALVSVTVVLMLFMGILANTAVNDERDRYIDTSFVSEFKIRNGVMVGDVSDRLLSITERYGYSGISLTIGSIGPFVEDTKEFAYGITDGDSDQTISGTVRLYSDDGRVAIASYRVEVWR